MDGKEITKRLKPDGGVKELAKKLGVTSPTVSQVIHGKRPNARIRQAIADAIGRPVAEVFPDQEA